MLEPAPEAYDREPRSFVSMCHGLEHFICEHVHALPVEIIVTMSRGSTVLQSRYLCSARNATVVLKSGCAIWKLGVHQF